MCYYSAKILKYYGNLHGYLLVRINGKHCKIHRLVATAFIPTERNKEQLQVHHKDGNRQNNRKNNLQWVSIKEHSQIHNKPKGKETE